METLKPHSLAGIHSPNLYSLASITMSPLVQALEEDVNKTYEFFVNPRTNNPRLLARLHQCMYHHMCTCNLKCAEIFLQESMNFLRESDKVVPVMCSDTLFQLWSLIWSSNRESSVRMGSLFSITKFNQKESEKKVERSEQVKVEKPNCPVLYLTFLFCSLTFGGKRLCL
jgi:hypothetical protein